uniref:C2H2-type domain-containing protein n=1 Tax=Setaria viridis TaxID=4556 RepID=A0A4U6WFK2_SETVI|nr:hypothetical protein SEVIR_1G282050v2 [Setaria viridis]
MHVNGHLLWTCPVCHACVTCVSVTMEAHQQKHKAYGTPGVHGDSSNVILKHSFKATIMRARRVYLSPLFLSFFLSFFFSPWSIMYW